MGTGKLKKVTVYT